MYREPPYLHAARRLPAADCLHWSRHASSSVSGARDRFDPLAGDTELVRREYMASGVSTSKNHHPAIKAKHAAYGLFLTSCLVCCRSTPLLLALMLLVLFKVHMCNLIPLWKFSIKLY
jgi:hypothetical protein